MSNSKAEKNHTTEYKAPRAPIEWLSFDEAFGGPDPVAEEEDVEPEDIFADYDDSDSVADVFESDHEDGESDHHSYQANVAQDGEAHSSGARGEAACAAPVSAPRILVILDINGVLLFRRGGGCKDFELRPHIQQLLDVWLRHPERLLLAVWSSMAWWNVEELVARIFHEHADKLAFVWDQSQCTSIDVPGVYKPLLRKDLRQLRAGAFAAFHPERVLIVDDDPAKCSANPLGTAIHPAAFEGTSGPGSASGAPDRELLALARYLEELVESGCESVRNYVLEFPFVSGKQEGSSCKRPNVSSDEDCEEPPAKRPHASGRGPMASEAAALPAEATWRRVESRSQPGNFYYFNNVTGENSLEPPPPWEKRASRSDPNVYYYWNSLTGATSVERPEV